MPFNSYSYLLLLGPAVVLFWSVPASWRKYYALALSVAFAASWGALYAPLPFCAAGIVWWAVRGINRSVQRRRFFQVTGITLLLAILASFKYQSFAMANLNAILSALGFTPVEWSWKVAMPLGISFYCFTGIAAILDARQGRVKELTYDNAALLLTYWPHFVSGPIVRVREILPQWSRSRVFQTMMLAEGLDRLIWGLVQKSLLANNLAAWVNEGFLPKAAAASSSLDAWTLAVAYGLQVYFDFAGYTNMAIGSAKLLGISLPENFRYPYHAASPPDFWSRWHISLSRWIRDYLFFPVNAKYKAAGVPLYVSLVAIMGLVGLWHGAGWGFVLWGLLHGSYLVLYRLWESLAGRRPDLAKSLVWRVFWRLFTVVAVVVAWVPFRAATLGQTLALLDNMFLRFRVYLSYNVNFYLLTGALALFCAIEPNLGVWLQRRLALSAKPGQVPAWRLLLARPILYALALLIFLIFDDQNTQFIYFQF